MCSYTGELAQLGRLACIPGKHAGGLGGPELEGGAYHPETPILDQCTIRLW